MSKRSIRKRRHEAISTYPLTRDERLFLEECAERIRARVNTNFMPRLPCGQRRAMRPCEVTP